MGKSSSQANTTTSTQFTTNTTTTVGLTGQDVNALVGTIASFAAQSESNVLAASHLSQMGVEAQPGGGSGGANDTTHPAAIAGVNPTSLLIIGAGILILILLR